MDLEQYEKDGRARYARMANVVADIIRHTLTSADRVGAVPQVHSRAKDVESLRRKLSMRDGASAPIEGQVKDLAGCRVVFYTNTDLDRFRQSDALRANFEIDWRESKTHFPSSSEASVDELYQGIHYLVRLSDARTQLPEYADLAGLRCEVQLQSILNHAWSETSHDILYKPRRVEGFGSKQFEALRLRFARVMRDHLMAAGYEMQKIQADAERLRAGQDIFDGAPLRRLFEARDNNEREDLLHNIRDHLLPGLDELSVHLQDIRAAVEGAIVQGRTTPTVPRDGVGGFYRGASSQDVVVAGLEIMDQVRYLDPVEAFLLLIRLWGGAESDPEKRAIEKSVTKIAGYHLRLWEHSRAELQVTLLEELEKIAAARRLEIGPLVLAACSAALSSEMQHSSMTSFDTITFTRASVVPHDTLRVAREKAIGLGLEQLHAAKNKSDWRAAWQCLWSGTHGQIGGTKDDAMRALQYALVRRLCDVVTALASRMSYEVRQEVEENLFWAYRRLWRKAGTAEVTRLSEEEEITTALRTCRDALNSDTRYVAFKTLVGFRTVFVEEWDDKVELRDKEQRRTKAIEAYAEAVTQETFDYWLGLAQDCAGADLTDGAAVSPLIAFFKAVSVRRSHLALELFLRGGRGIEAFASSILVPLLATDARASALSTMETWIQDGREVRVLGRVLFLLDEQLPSMVAVYCDAAVASGDVNACAEGALASLKHGDTQNGLWARCLVPTLGVLNSAGSAVFASWYMSDAVEAKLAELPEFAVAPILENFVHCQALGYAELRKVDALMLHEQLVWAMFERRLRIAEGKPFEERYEEYPRDWHELEAKLGADVVKTVDRVRSWIEGDGGISSSSKAGFLASLYCDCSDAFAEGLRSVVERDGASVVSFVCDVGRNFRGNERFDAVSLALIDAADDSDDTYTEICLVIEATGVTSGEFGRADALEAKAKRVGEWQQHQSAKVRAFASRFVQDLEKMIVEERRRGTERFERRRRDFDGPT